MALQLVGAGWGRTGTYSLYEALNSLGFRTHHMHEVFQHPEHAELFRAAARGEPDWDAIAGDYTAMVDWPGAAFWRELAAAFPHAKVLLSERDPDTWYESFRETIYHPIVNGGYGVIDDMFREVIIERELGGRPDDREHVIAAFERHNAEVRAEIPGERLLVYQPGDGWEPLCTFLDRPVPDEPFPHVNDRESFRRRRNL